MTTLTTRLYQWNSDTNSLLMLAGVQPREVDQLEKTSLLRRIGRENIFVEGEVVGQSVLAGLETAERWVAEQHKSMKREIVGPQAYQYALIIGKKEVSF